MVERALAAVPAAPENVADVLAADAEARAAATAALGAAVTRSAASRGLPERSLPERRSHDRWILVVVGIIAIVMIHERATSSRPGAQLG